MAHSLDKGERGTLSDSDLGPFRDGSAMRIVGEEPFRICKQLLDSVVKDHDEDICSAIKNIFSISSYTMH